MKLLGEKLIVNPVMTPVKVGSLYMVNQDKTYEAEVVFVGDELVEMFAPGDRLIYDKFAGQEMVIDERKLLLLKIGDVLAKIEG